MTTGPTTHIHSSEPSEPSSVTKFRENYLLFQLAFLSHKFSTEFYEFLRDKGTSPVKWRLLVNIMETPGIRVTTLAKNTLFKQSRVTKVTDQLCAEGLVLKTTGQDDRRQVNLTLTLKGKDVVLPLIQEAKRHEKMLLSQLDANDARHLKEILSKLTSSNL